MSQNTSLTPIQKVKDFLGRADFKEQIQVALPRHMNADRMLRIALTAALGQPKIVEACSHPAGQASIAKALLTASQLGVEVDGRQAHLVPFNDRKLGMIVQLIVGYQGLIGLAYNHPKVKGIWWAVVHEKDQFVYEDGLERKLTHVKFDGGETGDEDPGKLTHAYAVCEMEGGAKTFVVLNRREVMKSKKSSKSGESEYSPWTTHPEAMWAKTAVRALSKQIPQSNELREALSIEDEFEADERRFREAKPINGGGTSRPMFKAPSMFGAGAGTEEKPTPLPTTPPEDDPLLKLREKMVADKVDEASLITVLRGAGVDETLSSLVEIQKITPETISDTVEHWDQIKDLVAKLPKSETRKSR